MLTPASYVSPAISTQRMTRFGVVARALWGQETGSISYPQPRDRDPGHSHESGGGGTTIVYVTECTFPASRTLRLL